MTSRLGACAGALWLMAHAFFLPASAGAQTDPPASPPLRVAVYTVAPYVKVSDSGAIGGHSVQLWSKVAAELRRPFDLKPAGSVDAIVAGLRSGEFDVAVGALTVTPVREEQIDFSNATHPSGVAAAVRRESGFGSAIKALTTSTLDLAPLFLLVLGLLLTAGFVIWRLERFSATAQQTPHTTIASFGEGIYWAAVTMTTVGYGDKTPKSNYARVLTIIWMFIGVVVISIFSGTVTAKLTATQFATLDGSETALRFTSIGAVTNSSGAEFLAQSQRSYQRFDNLDAALDALQAGTVDAVFNSRGALVHHVLQGHAGAIEVLPNDLTRGWMAFALPPASPLKEDINRALLRVLSSRAWAAEREIMARDYGQSGRPDRTIF